MNYTRVIKNSYPVASVKRKKWKTIIKQQKYLLMMVICFVIWIIIFKYIPLAGWITSFQNYKPWKPLNQQEWVGFKYFYELFTDADFIRSLKNTVGMSLLGFIFGFPLPIVFALLINEIRARRFKRAVQTISYLPHFVSWVVVASLVFEMLSPSGTVNRLLMSWKLIDSPIAFMAEPKYFWWIVVFSDIWKEIGWNTIMFLAAMAGIDPELYEAATVDGASRFRKIWHVTIPGIMPTIIVILILCIGNLINIGFERQFLLRTSSTREVADVIDLYILTFGIGAGRFSFGTAAGMFKSVISLTLLTFANWFSKKTTGYKVV